MKRDPHKNPIPLTGAWSFKASGRIKPLEGSFWFVSSRLAMHRKANRMQRYGFEQCQMDVLVARRKEKGLTLELAEQPPPEPQQQGSKIQQFVRKHSGGCRGCGRKGR